MSKILNNSANESIENACVVCFKTVEIYSIGDCDHPVCYECSTRMRVLCRQIECPICRQDMPKVIFTTEPLPYKTLRNNNGLFDRKFRIIFASADTQAAYNALLQHHCSKCPTSEFPDGYRTFNTLKDHMRKEHELYYCDLCVENLKIFSFERRCYTRQELAQHRRKGDVDDTSHKGHPLCEFCDTRYMDLDELYRHLRRDHLYCHFCDADGFHHYYNSYDSLRDHFKNEHYLCEEGDCLEEEFTSVFRTEIDLKAHKASVHGRNLGKAAAKQARTLELEFTLAPRQRTEGGARGMSQRRPQSTRANIREERIEEGAVGYDTVQIDPGPSPSFKHSQSKPVDPLNTQDFPSLGGGNGTNVRSGNVNIRHTRAVGGDGALARTKENFPALGPPERGESSGAHVRLSVNTNSVSNQGPSSAIIRTGTPKAPNVSIHVSNRTNAGVTITSKAPSRASTATDDFPSLTPIDFHGVSNKHRSLVSDAYTSSVGVTSGPKVALVKQEQTRPSSVHQDQFKSGDPKADFPALGGSSLPQAKPQWLNPKQKKPTKVAPTPVQPSPRNFNDTSAFPTLNKTQKKKSTSVTVPVGGSSTSNWSESTNDKTTSKKKKKLESNGSSNDLHKKENVDVSKSENKSHKEVTKNDDASKSKSKKKTTNENSKQNGERKRSEIKIATLQNNHQSTTNTEVNENSEDITKSVNVNNIEQDFSSLGIAAPAGFNESRGPPPGFGPPPPGFSVTLNSVARPHSNGLTFISSSGQSYSIHPGLHNYVPPTDFARRNKNLVEQFQRALSSPDAMISFRKVSHQFREGSLSAQEYYDHCRNALSKDFVNIFPELLALLPDINKQQELYLLHSQVKITKGPKIDVCATCKQVLLAFDLKSHVQTHSLENHFPVLGQEVTAGNAWKK